MVTPLSSDAEALPIGGHGLVWLLEDSPLDAEHAIRALSACGVRVFRDGASLLEELARGDLPDVLLLDWELQGLSGIEVCRFIRRSYDHLTLPVVMLTVHSDKSFLLEALTAGANDFVIKPFHASELSARVGTAIRTKHLFSSLVRAHAELERERARVEESEAKYRRLAESGVIGVVETDLSGVLLDANDAFLALLGRSRAELAAGKLSHAPECRVLDERAIRELMDAGVTSHYEKEFVRPDGNVVIARVAAARVRRGQRCVAYVLDVTHERHVEADRARLFEAERRARADAELASRMKDEFLAIVSHELRTPMNAIVGWAEIMEHASAPSPQFAKAIEVIRRNARVQAKMIDDILDVSRVVAGKVRLEPRTIDLVTVIDQAIEVARPAAEAKRIEIERSSGETAIPLVADAERLQQIIWNLLSNAVKFTEPGGRVTISATPEPGRVMLEVSDTGRGIAPEHLHQIFDRFLQIDPTTTRSQGGLGLGLAICRHLVELHGGTIRARSEGLGHGATFSVCLPLEAKLPASAPEDGPASGADFLSSRPLSRAPSLVGLELLVVDDEDDSRVLAATILRAAGASVTECSSAKEAFQAFSAKAPDVLVTDVAMPGEDGYSLLRQVRDLPPENGGGAPCIAVTAYARTEDVARAIKAGFSRHLSKPFASASLIRVVADCARTSKPR
jgi:PAS domain S-box-containing protein